MVPPRRPPPDVLPGIASKATFQLATLNLRTSRISAENLSVTCFATAMPTFILPTKPNSTLGFIFLPASPSAHLNLRAFFLFFFSSRGRVGVRESSPELVQSGCARFHVTVNVLSAWRTLTAGCRVKCLSPWNDLQGRALTVLALTRST